MTGKAIVCPACNAPFVPGQRIALTPFGAFVHEMHRGRGFWAGITGRPTDEQPIPGAPSDPDPRTR